MGTMLLDVGPNVLIVTASAALLSVLLVGKDNPVFWLNMALGGLWVLGWMVVGLDWPATDTVDALRSEFGGLSEDE